MNIPSNLQTPAEAIDYLKELNDKITKAMSEIENAQPQPNFESFEECFKRLDANPALKFIPTGLRWFDFNLAGYGLAQGSFINLAGASFAGKTYFILQLLQSMGEKHKVAFFSYEMYEKVLYNKLKYSSANFRANTILIQDDPYLDSIERRIRKLAQMDVKLIAIDSRMKILLREKTDEYTKNVTISATISRVCRETGVIVILINQMNESDLKSGRLSLKGGNDQVYDSDMIFYLSYDDIKNERRLVCSKDRLSTTGNTWSVIIPNGYQKPIEEVEFKE
ncbi:RAD55 family ATPase [Campylobacter suis]|uniref:SF4 helicase domain-containing protein n=1 Tax=Campylobacter suis TaxID=2790657 RepID=A0ABN7KAG4_9BACT|nr:DnaB-like helicase C-terminal domain-containing protein [Campylobacter suis]CAD7288248.1 hypothetical protein LMG8286_01216 [Campylobacter suis]